MRSTSYTTNYENIADANVKIGAASPTDLIAVTEYYVSGSHAANKISSPVYKCRTVFLGYKCYEFE
jgi:hypothetical protein